MDSIFNLEEAQRSNLLQQIIHSFGFTYVCLWSHFPHHSSCLIFVDGVYKEENNQASSSSGSLAMMAFLDYQKSMFLIDNYHRRVPGFAFMHNLPYMEHTGLELLELASSSSQLQFYQEARIKVNIELKLKKLFPGDFSQEVLPQPLDQSRASSSSSSLRSLSMEKGVDYPPFLFNMLQTSSHMAEISGFQEPFSNHQAPNQTPSSSTMRSEDPLQQALSQIRATHLIPSREHEEAAMTRAILAAISSSPPPPSSSHLLQAPKAASAFKRYQTYLGPTKRAQNRQNLNIRSLSFFRNLREDRAKQEDRIVHTTRPTTNQLHHMISERKRREKLNDSFQALRSLLPPGSKKDKASVLSSIQEFIASIKSQVDELNARNKILEAEHSRKQILDQDSGVFSGERLNIRIRDANESTSDSRGVELEVNVRGNSILNDLVVRVLEFVNQVENVTITSIDARTLMLGTEAITNRVVLRLSIKGSEWNRSSFQEALTRALDDLA
ncbi:hypothetical protein L1987_01225 [Smallanthus sonchifolius]|uniref:Uncharacterized protein n=1 Tax=Smallanthus sonchifolius TaxID=185202 RepID=A0ACB9K4M3_9ASTR|nr:hypothetical protein L1987_01225 [Smallanthus sonchifolius]